MIIRSAVLIACSLGLMAAVSISPAEAQTFATSTDISGGVSSDPFTFTNIGATTITPGTETGFFSYNASAPVTFTFNTTNTLTGQPGSVTASLVSFNAYAVGAASTFGGNFIVQTVSTIQGEFEITSGSGIGKVLQFSFAQGTFSGQIGSSQATFSASDSGTNLTDYSSDYLNFGTQTSESLSFSLTSVANTPGGAQGPTLGADNTLQSFTSASQATFGANPSPAEAVPEPTAIAFALLGAGVSFVPVLRRKRASKA